MTGHNVHTKTVSDSFLRCLGVCCIQANDISELLILIPGHYPGPDADTDNYNRKLQEVKTRSGCRCPDWSTLIIFQKIEISAANRLIGEVVQSRRRPLLGPSPG